MSQGEGGGYGGVTVLLAFLGGAAVGAAVALLLAPRTGAEARRRLAGKAGELGDSVSRGAEVAREAALAAQAAFRSAMAEAEPGAAAPASPAAGEVSSRRS